MDSAYRWTDYKIYFDRGIPERFLALSVESAERYGNRVAAERGAVLERVEAMNEGQCKSSENTTEAA